MKLETTTPPRTLWIGGSYLAACRLTDPGAETNRLSDYILATINREPGITTKALTPKWVNESSVRRRLPGLCKAGLIHAVRKINRFKTPVDHWYPGPGEGK